MTRRGDRLRRVAAAIFDPLTIERVIDPAIADFQAEPFSVARYLAVLKVMVLCLPEVSMRFRAGLGLSALAAAAVVALLEAPPLIYARDHHAFDPRMVLYLIPQTISFALTIGLTLGTLCAFAGRRASRRAQGVVLALAIGVSGVAFVNNGWLVPDANQAFRELYGRRAGFSSPPARGFPEMTLGEVRARLSSAIENPGTLSERDLHYLAVSYQGRLAASIAPVMFAVFALVLMGLGPGHRWVVGLTACAAYLGYLLFLTEPKLVALDGPWLGGAAWYPLVALAVIIAAILAGSLVARALPARVSA